MISYTVKRCIHCQIELREVLRGRFSWLEAGWLASWSSFFILVRDIFFRSRRNIVRGPRASKQKAQGWATTPARNRKRLTQPPHERQTRKKGRNTAKHPKPEEASVTSQPTATCPTTTTGEAHTEWGSGPSNYTQALYRNARCTHAGPKAEKTGPRSLNKGPVQKHALHT